MVNLEKYTLMTEITTYRSALEWLIYNGGFNFTYQDHFYRLDICGQYHTDDGKVLQWYYINEVFQADDGSETEDMLADDLSFNQLVRKKVFNGRSFREIFPELKFYYW